MRVFNLGVAGVVASVFLFGSVGGVSAIEPFDLSSVSLQFQREVRSTYIIQFQADIAPSEVQGRANAIAARFQGRIRHTYTHALNGFSIRMNAAAMARLLDADDLGIARISRAVIMTVAQSNDNAANPTKGPPPGKGGGGGIELSETGSLLLEMYQKFENFFKSAISDFYDYVSSLDENKKKKSP